MRSTDIFIAGGGIIGLTTALAVFRQGWVVVGSLPVTNAGAGSTAAGCLIVLDSEGNPVETITGPTLDGAQLINGPWDMTSLQVFGPFAELFVTNVLNDTVANGTNETDEGTVLRLSVFEPPNGDPPVVFDTTTVGSGFAEELNSSALVLGPTRELASQVTEAIESIGSVRGLRTVAVYGGVPLRKQAQDARGAQILVATPGRLQDLVDRKLVSLADLKILVLDEPTSALDAQAEYELFGRLRAISAGRTAIYISHRFSTVLMADRIAVLERGRLAEFGSHRDLMAAGGLYAELFALQARAYG